MHSFVTEAQKEQDGNGHSLKRKRSNSPVRPSLCKVIPPQPRTAKPVGLFANFDKSNSLLTFPDSFVSCVNCGDLTALSKLMKSRINKQCEIRILKRVVELATFMKVFELMDDLYPDQVLGVEYTKIWENQLRTKLQFQFTENKMLRSVIVQSTSDPSLLSFCPKARTGDGGEEVLVRGSAWMFITFDPVDKHVTHFELKYNCSSSGM